MALSDLISAWQPAVLLAVGLIAALAGARLLTTLLHGLRPIRVTARPVLNKSEARVLRMLDPLVSRHFGPGARLLAQVSMGEFLHSRDRPTFLSINPRRVDFLIVDAHFMPLCALEYQGEGHHGSTRRHAARARHGDRVKRRALERARIDLVEIPARLDPAWIARELARISEAARQSTG